MCLSDGASQRERKAASRVEAVKRGTRGSAGDYEDRRVESLVVGGYCSRERVTCLAGDDDDDVCSVAATAVIEERIKIMSHSRRRLCS